MRILIVGMFALVAICRLAGGGEGISFAVSDPTTAMVRLLTDFGALGAFIIYLIWQRKKDSEQKAKDNERWRELDRELFTLVKECTKVIAECTGVLAELRKDVWRLIKKQGPPRESERLAPPIKEF